MTMTAHNVWMSLVLVTYSSKLTTSQHQRPKVCVNFDLIIMNQNHRSKVGKKERGRFVKSTSLENPYNTKPKKRDSLSRQWTKLLTTFYQLICYIQYMIDLHSVPETHIWDYIMHTLNYRHDTCTKSKTLDNNPGWQLFIISHVTKKQKYSKSFPVHGWTDIDRSGWLSSGSWFAELHRSYSNLQLWAHQIYSNIPLNVTTLPWSERYVRKCQNILFWPLACVLPRLPEWV